MGCLEHQKPHYSNSLVYKPQVQSIIILRDESICAQAYSSSGFQKTPKDEKEPPTRNFFFTLCRAFKAQWRVASHPVTWYLCLQEVFFNFSEQFRTAGRKNCNTVAPGYLLVNSFKIIIQKVYIYSVTEIIPVCSSTTSPFFSVLQHVWANRGRWLQNLAEDTSAAIVMGGQDRRAWLRMTQRCGDSCSRRRTGSVGDWSSSHQRSDLI